MRLGASFADGRSGSAHDFLLALTQTLGAESARAAVEDFVVDNGPVRTITEVAREVMTCAGWPLAP